MSPHTLYLCISAMTLAMTAPREGIASNSAEPRWTPPDLVQRGEMLWIGRFDADGNFIRDAQFPPYRHMPATLIGGNLLVIGGNRPTYEYRSGRLIQGTMADEPYSVFIPEIGSTVKDMNEFNLKEPDRIIWNRFESVGAFWTSARKRQFPNGLPRGKAPATAGVPDGWELVLLARLGHEYTRRFARVIGDVVEFGTLSEEGEFLPDIDLPVVSRAGIKSPIRNDPFSSPRYYTLPNDGKVTEEVYEFRSGRLIKGTLQKTGNFVPEIGSKVIDFKDYDPKGGRRIYNLPGVLRPVKK